MKLIFSSFLFLFLFSNAQAASCCGGGGGASALLTGDLKAVIRLNLSEKTYLADTSENNLSKRSSEEVDAMRTYSLSTSYKFKDFYQVGLALPMKERLRKLGGSWESETSAGDISFNFGYEYFSEYTYNPYLSQAIVFTSLTLPTGKSIYTTDKTDEMDVTGTGHEIYEIGTLLVKTFIGSRLDLQISLKHRPSKSFKNNVTTRPSHGQNYALTYTYDLNEKISVLLTQAYEYESMKLTAIEGLEKRNELLMPTSLGLLYGISEEYDASLTYTDDFLFGGENTALGKTIGLSFVKKFLL